MKITIKTSLLNESLNKVSKALSSKTPNPILTGLYFEVLDSGLKLIANDSNILIHSFIPLYVNDEKVMEIEEHGKAIIPGKLFQEVIKKVNQSYVEISLYENKYINVFFGESNFTLNGMDVDDYPPVNIITNNDPIILKKETLYQLIKQTVFATSSSENRPILTGINFKIEDNFLTCVATDSYRLAQKKIALDKEYPNINIVIPGRSLHELEKIIFDTDGEIYLYLSSNKAIFKFENNIFQTRLLEGKYPETSKLIPNDFGLKLTFDKEELYNSIDRVSLLSRESSTNVVKLEVNDSDEVIISSKSAEIGKVIDKIKVLEKEGAPITITFNSRYLIDALRSYNDNNIKVMFTGEIRPFILKGNDNNITQLVLPVRTE